MRDNEANGEKYEAYLGKGKWGRIASKDITVGMVLRLKPNTRVPSDCILLKTSEKDGSFVRTDQLDGETDWKLRIPVTATQSMKDEVIVNGSIKLWAQEPHEYIYEFVGKVLHEGESHEDADPLSLENTLWANCVLATGTALVCVIYTGKETRSAMNANQPSTKAGLIDLELNFLSKLLFVITLFLALVMVAFQRFAGEWYISFFRYVLLFSSIIPISLRVNLDMGKAVYSFFIMRDDQMQGVMVRNSNLPEELGRIGYLFSDKTGTLTKNEMVFRKLFTGSDVPKGWLHTDKEDMETTIDASFSQSTVSPNSSSGSLPREETDYDFTRAASSKQMDDLISAVTALAVAHNVTPVIDPDSGTREYQASSPDEVALVKFCESIGVILEYRDRRCMSLRSRHKHATLTDLVKLEKDNFGYKLVGSEDPNEEHIGWYVVQADNKPYNEEIDINSMIKLKMGGLNVKVEKRINYDILIEFPFTSESRRMGIIVRNMETKAIHLFMKGADTKMAEIVKPSLWLEEECTNLAREGLRTLVFGAKKISDEEFESFSALHKQALKSRDPKKEVEQIRLQIEEDLELIGMTGVEDKLQDDVAKTLEHLRKAGIRVWMLTGDKVETATCIARSTRLVAKDGGIFPFDCVGDRYESLWEREDGRDGWRPGKIVTTEELALDFLSSFERYVSSGSRMGGVTMVIDGKSLEKLILCEVEFVEASGKAASVVVARCSPTQKADIVEIMKKNIKGNLRTASIGDGGNDVSMILAAHVGLGIEGKEGKHASLAADYSLTKFCHCLRLITWHGRNSYKRSARLSQFVIHRGLIISFIQAVFSALFYFMSVPIYTGWLLVGYSTVYTMVPVFAMVLDEDATEEAVMEFPELYKELHKSRALNLRTFLQWVFKAVYQGGVIMLLAMYFFESQFLRIVTITFTALIMTELITVWFEMHKITWLFVAAELFSFFVYAISFFFLEELDSDYVSSSSFWWKTTVITVAACFPVTAAKVVERGCCEPSSSKLKEDTDPWIFKTIIVVSAWLTSKRTEPDVPSAAVPLL